jgi:hypothetical protein
MLVDRHISAWFDLIVATGIERTLLFAARTATGGARARVCVCVCVCVLAWWASIHRIGRRERRKQMKFRDCVITSTSLSCEELLVECRLRLNVHLA